MTINERIKLLITHLNYNPNSFSKEIGYLYGSTVNNIVIGRNNPGYEVLVKILQRFPAVNPRWLLLGDGEMMQRPELDHPAAGETSLEYGKSNFEKELSRLDSKIGLVDDRLDRAMSRITLLEERLGGKK